MSIKGVLAGVAVSDFDSARSWYERLLGRPPDEAPMDGLAEWLFPETGAIQLIHDPERAGRALLTVEVDDLQAEVGLLEERGLTPDAIDDTTSDKVKFAAIADPEGNTITLVEEL